VQSSVPSSARGVNSSDNESEENFERGPFCVHSSGAGNIGSGVSTSMGMASGKANAPRATVLPRPLFALSTLRLRGNSLGGWGEKRAILLLASAIGAPTPSTSTTRSPEQRRGGGHGGCGTLTALDLSDNRLDGADVALLCRGEGGWGSGEGLAGNESLTALDMSDNRFVYPEKAELAEADQDVAVEWTDDDSSFDDESSSASEEDTAGKGFTAGRDAPRGRGKKPRLRNSRRRKRDVGADGKEHPAALLRLRFRALFALARAFRGEGAVGAGKKRRLREEWQAPSSSSGTFTEVQSNAGGMCRLRSLSLAGSGICGLQLTGCTWRGGAAAAADAMEEAAASLPQVVSGGASDPSFPVVAEGPGDRGGGLPRRIATHGSKRTELVGGGAGGEVGAAERMVAGTETCAVFIGSYSAAPLRELLRALCVHQRRQRATWQAETGGAALEAHGQCPMPPALALDLSDNVLCAEGILAVSAALVQEVDGSGRLGGLRLSSLILRGTSPCLTLAALAETPGLTAATLPAHKLESDVVAAAEAALGIEKGVASDGDMDVDPVVRLFDPSGIARLCDVLHRPGTAPVLPEQQQQQQRHRWRRQQPLPPPLPSPLLPPLPPLPPQSLQLDLALNELRHVGIRLLTTTLLGLANPNHSVNEDDTKDTSVAGVEHWKGQKPAKHGMRFGNKKKEQVPATRGLWRAAAQAATSSFAHVVAAAAAASAQPPLHRVVNLELRGSWRRRTAWVAAPSSCSAIAAAGAAASAASAAAAIAAEAAVAAVSSAVLAANAAKAASERGAGHAAGPRFIDVSPAVHPCSAAAAAHLTAVQERNRKAGRAYALQLLRADAVRQRAVKITGALAKISPPKPRPGAGAKERAVARREWRREQCSLREGHRQLELADLAKSVSDAVIRGPPGAGAAAALGGGTLVASFGARRGIVGAATEQWRKAGTTQEQRESRQREMLAARAEAYATWPTSPLLQVNGVPLLLLARGTPTEPPPLGAVDLSTDAEMLRGCLGGWQGGAAAAMARELVLAPPDEHGMRWLTVLRLRGCSPPLGPDEALLIAAAITSQRKRPTPQTLAVDAAEASAATASVAFAASAALKNAKEQVQQQQKQQRHARKVAPAVANASVAPSPDQTRQQQIGEEQDAKRQKRKKTPPHPRQQLALSSLSILDLSCNRLLGAQRSAARTVRQGLLAFEAAQQAKPELLAQLRERRQAGSGKVAGMRGAEALASTLEDTAFGQAVLAAPDATAAKRKEKRKKKHRRDAAEDAIIDGEIASQKAAEMRRKGGWEAAAAAERKTKADEHQMKYGDSDSDGAGHEDDRTDAGDKWKTKAKDVADKAAKNRNRAKGGWRARVREMARARREGEEQRALEAELDESTEGASVPAGDDTGVLALAKALTGCVAQQGSGTGLRELDLRGNGMCRKTAAEVLRVVMGVGGWGGARGAADAQIGDAGAETVVDDENSVGDEAVAAASAIAAAAADAGSALRRAEFTLSGVPLGALLAEHSQLIVLDLRGGGSELGDAEVEMLARALPLVCRGGHLRSVDLRSNRFGAAAAWALVRSIEGASNDGREHAGPTQQELDEETAELRIKQRMALEEALANDRLAWEPSYAWNPRMEADTGKPKFRRRKGYKVKVAPVAELIAAADAADRDLHGDVRSLHMPPGPLRGLQSLCGIPIGFMRQGRLPPPSLAGVAGGTDGSGTGGGAAAATSGGSGKGGSAADGDGGGEGKGKSNGLLDLRGSASRGELRLGGGAILAYYLPLLVDSGSLTALDLSGNALVAELGTTRGRLGGGGSAADEAMECEVAVLGAAGGVTVAGANALSAADFGPGGAAAAGAGRMAVELGAGRRMLFGATGGSLVADEGAASHHRLATTHREGAAADGSDGCAIDTARGAALRLIMRALRPLVEAPSGPEAGEPTLLRKLNLQGNGIDSASGAVLREVFGPALRVDHLTT